MKKIKEKISLLVAKDPKQMILLAILGFNILFLLISAGIISIFAPSNIPNHGFWASVFYTITMILDAGCIQFVVEDVGQAGVGIVIACLAIVLIGMVTFTGAVIGYFTNYISEFINTANAGARKLTVCGHIVILNWNTRAVEIINDLLYSENKEKIVVLVSDRREKIEKEISNRLSSTIQQENERCKQTAHRKRGIKRYLYYRKHRIPHNKLTVIVRQGDVYSTKDLMDVSVDKAKTVIILGRDINNSVCKYNNAALLESREKGDPFTVKVLAQVAELTSNERSADDQKIVVEAEDDWTLSLIQKIIEQKENLQKCNIVPISVNQILGQLLSQFSIMPELNMVYSELFSNRGATIYSYPTKSETTEEEWVERVLNDNSTVIPLTYLNTRAGRYGYYVANSGSEVSRKDLTNAAPAKQGIVRLQDYQMSRKNVIVFGHNSNCLSIMEGFRSFCNEWGTDALNILVIDSAKSLEKFQYYSKFPFVRQIVEADIYDKELIYKSINTFVDSNQNDTSILILSDDKVASEDIDSNALTALIYMCDILEAKLKQDSDYDVGRMDVIVEILNPKHYDIVNHYGKNNIVISNRYISKMVTQVGTKESLYEFYKDILEYDDHAKGEQFSSKEIYIKEVSRFFDGIPPACTAYDLIREVYAAGKEDNKTLLLGYIDKTGKQTLFSGKQRNLRVELTEQDKVIVFSNH